MQSHNCRSKHEFYQPHTGTVDSNSVAGIGNLLSDMDIQLHCTDGPSVLQFLCKKNHNFFLNGKKFMHFFLIIIIIIILGLLLTVCHGNKLMSISEAFFLQQVGNFKTFSVLWLN